MLQPRGADDRRIDPVNSDDPRLVGRHLDGQHLLVPTEAGWEALGEDAQIDGRPLGVGRMPATYRSLAAKLDGLSVALGDDPTPGKPWWILHVVEVDGVLHRVQVEGQACVCGWSGVTGNVRDYQLYAGTPDPWATLQAYWHTPTIPCPGCDAPLPRPAVWIGSPRDDDSE